MLCWFVESQEDSGLMQQQQQGEVPGPNVSEGFLSTGVFSIPELYNLTRG